VKDFREYLVVYTQTPTINLLVAVLEYHLVEVTVRLGNYGFCGITTDISLY